MSKLVGRSAKLCPHCGESLNPTYMTEAQQRDAIERYQNGETLYGLAVRFKREISTIRRLMQRNGIRKNAPRNSQSNRQRSASITTPVIANPER